LINKDYLGTENRSSDNFDQGDLVNESSRISDPITFIPENIGMDGIFYGTQVSIQDHETIIAIVGQEVVLFLPG